MKTLNFDVDESCYIKLMNIATMKGAYAEAEGLFDSLLDFQWKL